MASSMRCCKSALTDGWRWLLLWVLCLLAGLTHASSELGGVQLKDFELKYASDGVHLSAQLDIVLSSAMSDALQKGVPLYFVAEASILKERWYWRDGVLGQTRRHMRLVYQPLTRRWRLNSSSSPLMASGLGVSLSQNFETLDEALQTMGGFAQWRIGSAELKGLDASHRVLFEFGIDAKQLPRPFVIGQSGGVDWSLRLSHEALIPEPSP